MRVSGFRQEKKRKKSDYDSGKSIALPLALFTNPPPYGLPRHAQRSEGGTASAQGRMISATSGTGTSFSRVAVSAAIKPSLLGFVISSEHQRTGGEKKS